LKQSAGNEESFMEPTITKMVPSSRPSKLSSKVDLFNALFAQWNLILTDEFSM
jgi:hypothetical protein